MIKNIAESSFSLRLSKYTSRKTGWRILPIFSIELHKTELTVLKQINSFFALGVIYLRKTRNGAIYYVQSFDDLTNVIISHFNKYPLNTKKKGDFFIV